MKKYEYVSINIGKKAMPKIYFGAKSKEHRKIIDQYAEKGYKYVGFIPTNITDGGLIVDIDLIFEIDAK
ncbi:MAG: DUF4177 domain-containing protein [Cyanobacteria bacterium SIG29]|nr:DUF4177 domain-containing protein [Cyanobacteria bacterium SIG29]